MDLGSSMSAAEATRLKKGEVNLGTTVMAVVFEGGVIIGADSRTTTGSYIVNRVTDKLTHITDQIYCCRSGSAADTQAIADMVHYNMQMMAAQADGKPQTVKTAATLFEKICYQNKAALTAGILVAGWDEECQGSVYGIPLGGGLFKSEWTISGSGSAYIYGFCDSNYRAGMTEEETVDFVRQSIALAIARDGSSGGCARMCVITKDGARRVFVPGDEVPLVWNMGNQSANVVSIEGMKISDAVMAES